MNQQDTKEKVRELLEALTDEEKLLLRRVLMAEQEKLHMGNPLGIRDDLYQIVREVIK